MKRISVLFLMLCCTFMLIGCGNAYDSDDINHAYRSGYNDGYDDGYSAGLDEGFEDAQAYGTTASEDDVSFAAEQFARDMTGWSPEEASAIVSDYLHGTNYTGSRPSQQEFYEAVDTLDAFYMYFY